MKSNASVSIRYSSYKCTCITENGKKEIYYKYIYDSFDRWIRNVRIIRLNPSEDYSLVVGKKSGVCEWVVWIPLSPIPQRVY